MKDIPDLGRCTIQIPNDGRFCDQPADKRLGYSICGQHARHVAQDVARLVEYEAAWPDGATQPTWSAGQVYYLLIDGLIKIGHTRQALTERLRDYPPSTRLLATEPGGRDLEAKRCSQFNAYLSARREWFAPHPALREFIESLPTYQAA